MSKELRHGFTTGACAAAAALGAARMLGEQRLVHSVELFLPAGFAAIFQLQGQSFTQECAACFVVKDAGDDPDVTNGVEVHAEVSLLRSGGDAEGVIITGGVGVGRVTKPGLAVPLGEWAINPVPRRMITEAVQEVFPPHSSPPFAGTSVGKPLTPRVIISIPDGEQKARHTLNERLGIIGGLSILGTTGVVKPISHKAWTDTLEVALDVALASGSPTVVLSTGRTSEMAAQKFFDSAQRQTANESGSSQPSALAPESYVMMGDHVAHALESCHKRGFGRIVLAAQFAKLVKIAAGHPSTHVGDSRLDLCSLAAWARESDLDEDFAKKIECANTAREVYESVGGERLAATVAPRALVEIKKRTPGASVAILLVDYRGRPAASYGEWSLESVGNEK